jgi:hypothetical protein
MEQIEKKEYSRIEELHTLLQAKINYLTKHPDDHNAKKLPGLVEALKDLREICYK